MKVIKPEMKIGEILKVYPETLDVFKANGFAVTTKEDLFNQFPPWLMLKTALQVKVLNQEVFINLLDEKIRENQVFSPVQDDVSAMKRLDFLGYTYCPLKFTFKDCFEEVAKEYLAQTGDRDFQSFVPSGCGDEEDCFRENICQVKNIDDFPAITVASGFGDFLSQEFVDRFVKKGYFKSVGYERVNDDFAAAGYEDPAGWYSVYSVLPMVMLVDIKKLGSLPVPKRWSDLLNPIYRNNIIIGASHGDIHEDLLFYTYQEHGDAGLHKLAANVKAGMHGAEMAKIAGSGSSQGAAIYVIAWLFAKACPRTEGTITIWPEDGALITPMYLLVKEKQSKNLQPFIDLVMGTHYGQKSADNYFPVLHPQVDNKLPEKATFKWLGWEYIRAHSLEDLKEHVVTVFKKAWDNK